MNSDKSTVELELAIEQAQKELNGIAACLSQADYLPVVIEGLQGTVDPEMVDLLELAELSNQFRQKIGILQINMETRAYHRNENKKTEAA